MQVKGVTIGDTLTASVIVGWGGMLWIHPLAGGGCAEYAQRRHNGEEQMG